MECCAGKGARLSSPPKNEKTTWETIAREYLMKYVESQIERLLRSASGVPDEPEPVAPFGFDTRVIALWQAGITKVNGNGVARLVGRVAILAAAVIVVSTAATIREFQQTQ